MVFAFLVLLGRFVFLQVAMPDPSGLGKADLYADPGAGAGPTGLLGSVSLTAPPAKVCSRTPERYQGLALGGATA